MKTATLSYRIPYADTDQMGVVYYANYYVYFERGRTEFLRSCNLPYNELEAQGIFLPVVESHCEYFASARYDDLITIEAAIDYIKGARVKINCKVFNESGTLLVEGYTVHATIDKNNRPCRAAKVFSDLDC